MKYNVCKIKVNDILCIFEDGNSDTIPSMNITFMKIEKNFFNNFLPILNIKALVSRNLYKKINSGITKFKIELNKFFLPNEEDYNKNDYSIMYHKFISDIFININNSDTSMDPTENIAEQANQNDFEKNSIMIDLLLFSEDALNYRKLNKFIFNKCTMVECILGLAQLTEQGSILLSFPDNDKYYSGSIIIPNNYTFIGCIKYLQNIYGLYNNGYILFKDYNKLYLVDKSLECNAYELGEFKRIYINYSEMTTSEGNMYGQYKNNANMTYTINAVNNPNIITTSTASNELNYDNLNIINSKLGSLDNKSITMNKSTKYKTDKILENKYNNEYINNSIIHEIELNNKTISINFNEVDLDLFTPNKEFYLNINISKKEYTNINGLIKLSKVIGIYEKKDDESFTGLIVAEFKSDRV